MTAAWTAEETARLVPAPTAADDKYTRGVVGVRTGSDRYPGAAVLGVEAAWRTGVGMVRYLGPRFPTELVLRRRPETVCAPGRVQAWVIGSGTDAADRDAAETDALREILGGQAPVVIDAGAVDLAADGSAPRIVTPHDGEHARLRDLIGLPAPGPDRAAAARETSAALGAVVLLKGAATLVAAPDGSTRVVAAETSRLATAGTGDVLAGIVGGLAALSRTAALAEIAAAAAWLHSAAGAAAVRARGGGPITALDVAEALPGVIGRLR
ncbi:NAD(P)H-hydrate dehydratase [Microbacterium sp.]|uniref:NAD(P)H-hydrate dehydratase n=1 Tax=Microbacterium sp. TaxID=51671 RepID=UPI003A8850A3